MAQQTIDDRALLEALFDVFRRYGYEGATLALLSEVTGLKKSSLYHRYPAGKEDMANAVVSYVSTQLHEQIIGPLLNSENTPKNRFSSLIGTINTFYNDGKKNCLLNVLCLGEVNSEIKAQMNQDYGAWLSALIHVAKEAGMSQRVAELRSEHFLIVVEGALVIQRLTSNAQTFKNAMEYEQKQFFN